MPTLPFDEKLNTSAQLALLARRFFDVWWLYESVDSRPIILKAMNRFPEFFSTDGHAHFAAMVNHLASLFENRKDTINFQALLQETTASSLVSNVALAEAKNILQSVATLRPKVAILRSNLFSHRSASLSYDEAFRKAAITPFQLRDLTDAGISIANILLVARGQKECSYIPAAPEQLRMLLDTLLPPVGS
jgi:hypothetical protein